MRHKWTKRARAEIEGPVYWQQCERCKIERRCIWDDDRQRWFFLYPHEGDWHLFKHVPECK